MFNLLRSTQLVSTLVNGVKLANEQSVARFCTADVPRRVEKTINNVTLLGRVGSNPQVRGNENAPVVTFSLATHTNFKIEGGDWAQRTDWHQIAVFNPTLRESVKNYLTKGQRVLVSGRISYSEYTDKDGNARTSTSIAADDVTFFT